jgi:carboxypeptidase Taq
MADTKHVAEELQAAGAELLDLGRIGGLLGWDQETIMPPAGAPFRARARATLEALLHERLTRPRMGELLAALAEPAAAGQLSAEAAATVRVLRRDYDRAVKVPTALVRELAQTTSEAVEVWRRAREASRFGDFAPILERIVALKRQEAEYIGYAAHPYDALLDAYEPEMTVAQLEPLFGGLRAATVALLERLRGATHQPNRSLLERGYDEAAQWAIGEDLLRAIGFDFAAGRMDRSTHPFAEGLGAGDVRITTRLSEDDLAMSLFGTLHEGGHALYEQGYAEERAFSFVGTCASLGIHESQSRLWENLVGRGRPFWQFALPRLRARFPTQLNGVDLDEFLGAINTVAPSLIRVEADEVTYNLHIILRFELERRLIGGELAVADLPDAWNEQTRDLLGLTPPDDRSGVLQDTHWALGYFGYFPTYTLGNLYAAQLWRAIRRDLPELDNQIAAGEFAPLLGWLRERIHRQGQLYPPAELIERATGAPPQPEHLVRYLTEKFESIYRLA